MKRRARSLLGALILATTACNRAAPEAPPREPLAPQWQDVFDGTPDLFAVLRPQAIKRDAVYGALFKHALQMTQARSEMRGATTLEALEGSEEILIGIRRGGQGDEAALVIRGVPARLDAATMTDAAGQPVFHLVDARARVPEYEWIDRKTSASGALFVLPDRTWIGTVGEARQRARQAFALPSGHAAPPDDPQALATVRVEAAALRQTPRLAQSAALGVLTRKLRNITFALMPTKGGLVTTLQYEDENASAWAEVHMKRVLGELAARPALAWLKDAQIGHEGRGVRVVVAIPKRLLEELPRANSADFPL